VILIHQRYRQTDRQTDGRHAISIPRYALVHRAVKMVESRQSIAIHTKFSLGLFANKCRIIIKQDAVLSQGGPRDAAVNFGTYRSLSDSFHCDSNAFELNNSTNHGKITVLNISICCL